MPSKFPQKDLCGSLICVLSQEMRHIDFFPGAPKWGFGWGGKKFMLEKSMCVFFPLVMVAVAVISCPWQ